MSKKITVGKIEQLTNDLPKDFGKGFSGMKGFPEVIILESQIAKLKKAHDTQLADIDRLLGTLSDIRNWTIAARHELKDDKIEAALDSIKRADGLARQTYTELIKTYGER